MTAKQKNWCIAIVIAAALVLPGWYFEAQDRQFNSPVGYLVQVFFLVVLFPGFIPAVIVSSLLSPQGMHGDEYVWLTIPFTFAIYSVLFATVLNRGLVSRAKVKRS